MIRPRSKSEMHPIYRCITDQATGITGITDRATDIRHRTRQNGELCATGRVALEAAATPQTTARANRGATKGT